MTTQNDDPHNKAIMTEAQFYTLVSLMRGSVETPANIAARQVLVEGISQTTAWKEAGVSRSTASDAITRYRNAFEKINLAWGLEPAAPEPASAKKAAAKPKASTIAAPAVNPTRQAKAAPAKPVGAKAQTAETKKPGGKAKAKVKTKKP